MRHGDKGLRQQGDGRLAGGQCRHTLAVLALPVDGHILVRVNAVFRQQIPQGIFRGAALTGGHDGLALQVRHRLHRFSVFHDIQHTKGVHRQHLHGAAGLAVQHGGQIGGDTGHVQVALDEGGGHLVGGTGQGEFVGIAGGYHILLALHHLIGRVAQTHQFHQAHGGGAFQCSNSEMGSSRLCTILRFVRRFFRLGRLLWLLRFGGFLAAGSQGQGQGQRQAQRQQFFLPVHGFSSFHTLPAGA